MIRQTIVLILHVSVLVDACKIREFGENNIVCECSSSYCDFYEDPKPPEIGTFISYTTTKGGVRMYRRDGDISSEPHGDSIVKIDSNIEYQRMEGFGGAFTDAAGYNIRRLSRLARSNLMRSYFSTNGSKYNLGRVPIGGTDFSVRPYTYDDYPNDVELKNFELFFREDYVYKMSLMHMARALNPSIRFLASAWTAPPWMKSNHRYNGFGWLRQEYYQTYADYIVRFLEEYKKRKLDMWTVSTGNEPLTALNPLSRINSMFWEPYSASKWVRENLGPSLENSSSNGTRILMVDDQRIVVPKYAAYLSGQLDTLQYVDGLAVHGYLDDFVPAYALDIAHMFLPDKFILCTEFSIGDRPWEFQKVVLGSWQRAETLIKRLFQNINHWVAGWVDWNLALDMEGGPNWVGNRVDAPIIVDAENDVFYKQPMYYVMMHFSKFVTRSAVRIDATSPDYSILSTAFKTLDNYVIVVLYNYYGYDQNVSIHDEQVGYINVELPKYSLHTFMYKV